MRDSRGEEYSRYLFVSEGNGRNSFNAIVQVSSARQEDRVRTMVRGSVSGNDSLDLRDREEYGEPSYFSDFKDRYEQYQKTTSNQAPTPSQSQVRGASRAAGGKG